MFNLLKRKVIITLGLCALISESSSLYAEPYNVALLCRPSERLMQGRCIPAPIICKPNERSVNGQCLPMTVVCKSNEKLVNGQCIAVPLTCKPNERLSQGQCVPLMIICKPHHQLYQGKCIPIKNNKLNQNQLKKFMNDQHYNVNDKSEFSVFILHAS